MLEAVGTINIHCTLSMLKLKHADIDVFVRVAPFSNRQFKIKHSTTTYIGDQKDGFKTCNFYISV